MSRELARLSICIISHQAYGAMVSGASGRIGGVEWQTSLMARWLAAAGHPVSLLTWDDGGPANEEIDGVRIIKICPERAGLPGVRFFHPKWTGLLRAMQMADADVYYQNGGECVTGQAALWCRRRRKPFVFCAASDADCDPRLPELRTARERLLYRCGLRRADRIVVQTVTQQEQMLKLFSLPSTVIPMPCPGPNDRDFVPPDRRSQRILWIGRIKPVKRPDRLLDLAETCPDLTFDVVGPTYEEEYSQAFCRRASQLPNVTMHGAAPRPRVADFYKQAAVLCCTSDYEGFPNTFLEAWSHGLPIVSTVNPDGLIEKRQLGRIARETAALAKELRFVLGSPGSFTGMSANARRYYCENHTVDAVLPKFLRVFEEAARSKSRAAGSVAFAERTS